jgi:hypothetical protein
MKENTSATVPGTTVNISIMKTIEGGWKVTRTAQLGIALAESITFLPRHREYACEYAQSLWELTIDARNAQIARADADAYAGFDRAQARNSFIIEVRFDD